MGDLLDTQESLVSLAHQTGGASLLVDVEVRR
jgi:hypothetical protein